MFDNRLQPSNEPLIPSSYTTTEQTQPLFTLTAEEVIVVKHFLTYDKMQLETYETSQENDIMIEDLNHILTRIKQWQDENRTNN